MKLFTSIGPNPRVVKMFAAEKGLQLEQVSVDIIGGENRRPPYLAFNPAGQTPALELDSGAILGESIAICEYLEELHPQPPLIGATPEARAATRMWLRRIDFNITQPMTAGFRAAEGLPLFQDRVRCLTQSAQELKLTAREGIAWIERQMGEQPYITGEAVTAADILLFCFLEFGALVGQGLDPDMRKLSAWHARMAARPSAAASA